MTASAVASRECPGGGRRKSVPVLQGEGRDRRLQGRGCAAARDQRQGQDPLVAGDRSLPAPPVPARPRRQARPRARPPAVRLSTARLYDGSGDSAGRRRDARGARRRHRRVAGLPAQLPRSAQARPAGHPGGDRRGRSAASRRPSVPPRRRPRRPRRPRAAAQDRPHDLRTRRATTAGCSARSPRRRSSTPSGRRAVCGSTSAGPARRSRSGRPAPTWSRSRWWTA